MRSGSGVVTSFLKLLSVVSYAVCVCAPWSFVCARLTTCVHAHSLEGTVITTTIIIIF